MNNTYYGKIKYILEYSHRWNDVIEKNLLRIEKEKKTHQGIESLSIVNDIVQSLAKYSLLTEENALITIKKTLADPTTTVTLPSAVDTLFNSGLLNDENLQILLTLKTPSSLKISWILQDLSKLGLLKAVNSQLLLKTQGKLSSIITGFILQEIIQQHNFSCLDSWLNMKTSIDLEKDNINKLQMLRKVSWETINEMGIVLQWLKEYSLYTPENITKILSFPQQASEVFLSLECLLQANLFTQENFDAIFLNPSQYAFFIFQALFNLQTSNRLIPENLQFIADHPHLAEQIATIYFSKNLPNNNLKEEHLIITEKKLKQHWSCVEIKKAARLIQLAKKYSFFHNEQGFILDNDIGANIASFVGDRQVHDAQAAKKIADDSFGRTKNSFL